MTNFVPLFTTEPRYPVAQQYIQQNTTNRAPNIPNVEPPSALLQAIRSILQNSSPTHEILGRSTRPSLYSPAAPDELVWTRNTVIWTAGDLIRRHLRFADEEEEEVRSACFANFGVKGSDVLDPKPLGQDQQSKVAIFPENESASVFGTYGRVMRSSVASGGSRSREHASVNSDGEKGPGTEIVIRAICVFMRTYALIVTEDGAEYRIDLPFLTNKAWPLHPIGVMLERDIPPFVTHYTQAILNEESSIYTLTNPLRTPTPIALAQGILYPANGQPEVFQQPKANTPFTLHSWINPREHVLFVEDGLDTETHHIVLTIDPAIATIQCYCYAYKCPPTKTAQDILKTSSPLSNALDFQPTEATNPPWDDSSSIPYVEKKLNKAPEWLMKETPPPPAWREVAQGDLPPAPSFTHSHGIEEEDGIEPYHWAQLLLSVPIDQASASAWNSINVVDYNNIDQEDCARRFAIYLPGVRSYREITVQRIAPAVPYHLRASLTATIDNRLHPAISIHKVTASRPSAFDLLVLKPNKSLLLISGDSQQMTLVIRSKEDEMLAGVSDLTIRSSDGMDEDWESKLQGANGSLVIDYLAEVETSAITVCFAGGAKERFSLAFFPRNKLVDDILSTLQFVLPSAEFSSLRAMQLQSWISKARPTALEDEITCLWDALFALLGEGGYSKDTNVRQSLFDSLTSSTSHKHLKDDFVLSRLRLPSNYSRSSVPSAIGFSKSPYSAPVLFALHLLGQALKVDSTRLQELPLIAPPILRLANEIAPIWADYWSRICPDATGAWNTCLDNPPAIPNLPTQAPCSIMHCFAVSSGQTYPQIKSLARTFSYAVTPFYSPHQSHPDSIVQDIHEAFACIRRNLRVSSPSKAEELLLLIIRRRWTLDFLDRLPMALSTPIREILRICQLTSKTTHPPEAYELIDRMDLYELAKGGMPPAEGEESLHERTQDTSTDEIISAAQKSCSGNPEASIEAGNAVKDSFTEIRWADDRRLEEVVLMLQSSRIPSVKLVHQAPESEHEREQHELLMRVTERTLSLPFGRALLTYGCVVSATPDSFVIPKIELSVRIVPKNVVLMLDPTRVSHESRLWGDFHNGVASGLRISALSTSVESPWIQYIKPNELSSDHAGFLFGLGLNGHLKSVDTWNTFSYLSPKHEQTSIALLLGLAASNVGSANHYITRLIAIHTPALLPIRTVEINVSLLTQSAGLVALGLVFMGTGDRAMADVALKEISRQDLMALGPNMDDREAYTLAAGMSFGMIMVGKGSKTASPADATWLNRFRSLIHGSQGVEQDGIGDIPAKLDLNITTPGACLALAMLYLKSNRTDVAEIVAVPTTRHALDTIPPHLLLLRTLAKALIMWDEIVPSTDWINSLYVPMKTAVAAMNISGEDMATLNAADIAGFNVIAGACFALALKYAGTASADAWKVVVSYYDILLRGVYATARNYEHSIRRQATRDAVNVMSCALAIITAGSGDLSVLQRLRFAHGKVMARSKFGMHVANHMAMGMLFLGGGRYTLGTSNAAVCSLLVSFYPRFPLAGFENRFHLQALRHLWVLAVEPRCLMARDVQTRKVIYLPLKIRVGDRNNKVGSLQLMAPTLLPDFDAIRSLRVDSPRYWSVFIDYMSIPRFKEAFIRHQTLWVKRHRGFLGYYEDPQSTRSNLVATSGGAMGDPICMDAPEVLEGLGSEDDEISKEFISFMKSFTLDSKVTTLTDRIGKAIPGAGKAEKAWVTFAQSALIDCFTSDKPQMIPSYLALHALRSSEPERKWSIASSVWEFLIIRTWYQAIDMRRPELIRRGLIKSVSSALDDRMDALRSDPHFRPYLRNYILGKALEEDGMHFKDAQQRRKVGRQLAFYLTASSTPPSISLVKLKKLLLDTVRYASENGTQPRSIISGLRLMLRETVMQAFMADWQWQTMQQAIEWWLEDAGILLA